VAHYINSEGKASTDTFGPELKTDDAKSRKTRCQWHSTFFFGAEK
jgi:hypothetical protein